MSVTVADCLKLSSLREAKVLGGHGGLHKPISCVTVLEYADLTALRDAQFYLGNEMIITAFASIKDDVEAQCKVIQRMHEMGEVCIVLYYVGIYVPNVDINLIKLSNELDFPLIIMPPNRYSHRYSDVIAEVMNAIFNDQRLETNFVSGILDQIAQLKYHQRNIGTVMRILSDRLRCTLLLADRNGKKRAFAPWPLAAQWNENDLNIILEQRQAGTQFGKPIELHINDREVQVHSMTLNTEKQKGLVMLAIDESRSIDKGSVNRIIEVLQLFASIWKDDFTSEGPDALVRAILSNQPDEMRRIARQLCIDVEALNTMWVLRDKKEKQNISNGKDRKEWLATRLISFLKENYGTVLVDVFEDYVVAFIDSVRHSHVEAQLDKQFIEEIKSDCILFNCTRLSTSEDVRTAYLLLEENFETACRIYPLKNILTQHELHFAKRCRAFLEAGETEVKRIIKIIDPLLQDEAGRETFETLAAFSLDCQGSIVETSNRLYVHKNTVKYRIKKAQNLCGFDVMKMPEMMDLYVALALKRLLP